MDILLGKGGIPTVYSRGQKTIVSEQIGQQPVFVNKIRSEHTFLAMAALSYNSSVGKLAKLKIFPLYSFRDKNLPTPGLQSVKKVNRILLPRI